MNQEKTLAKTDLAQLLPEAVFSLLKSFSEIVGLQMKWCGGNGRPLSAIPTGPLAGPCCFLSAGSKWLEACAGSHADAIKAAHTLRHPYIFICHAHLAAWAIPILSAEPLSPAAIICGGALLKEPDAALTNHLEKMAANHEIESAALFASLDDLPVVSRDYFRSAGMFIFDLINAFMPHPADIPAETSAAPRAFSFLEQSQLPLIFPPQRRKDTKKASERKSVDLQQRNVETELVRLLRERQREEAMRSLLALLRRNAAPSGSAGAPRADAAEVLARLFRALAQDRRPDENLQERQAALLKDALGLTHGPEGKKNLVRLCDRFVSIADEMVVPRPRQLKTIQKYLEKNLTRKLTLGTVGKKFGLKEKPLNELILRNCGMSFTDYVISLRVSEAKRLLQMTELNLGQIALKTGFTDQSYFTKVFRTTTGITPSEFRNKI